MLCNQLIKEKSSQKEKKPTWFGLFFVKYHSSYGASLRWALDHYGILLSIAGIIIEATFLLFYLLPKGFIPSQDSGMIFSSLKAPECIDYKNFVTGQTQAKSIIQQNPNVAAVVSSVA